MADSTPLVSVIIPAFNAEAFIADAIGSVLAQAYRPLDVVVVDDGSADATAAIAGRHPDPVRCVGQSNLGSSRARNHGVRVARGEFLAFLDADDLWSADKLTVQSDHLKANPSVDLVWGHVVEFRDGEVPSAHAARPVPGYHPGAMLVRRAAFDRVGPFSEAFRQAEVVDWVSRVADSGLTTCMLPDVVMFRRLHAGNKGRGNALARRQYLQILKQHLDRIRAGQ